MRWENEFVPNSTQDSQILLLTQKIADLEKRIEALEMRDCVVVEADGTYDLTAAENRSWEREPKVIHRPSAPVKRGRRPRISLDDYQSRRNDLLTFLQIRWSDLAEVMLNPENLEHLLRTIDSASPGAKRAWTYQHLAENIGTLWTFLMSGRYTGQPIQIANAIAGVPELSWRSSLDRGSKILNSQNNLEP